MSERKFLLLIIWIMGALGLVGMYGWYRQGKARGRAEQKKLDEVGCAAHPAVKDVQSIELFKVDGESIRVTVPDGWSVYFSNPVIDVMKKRVSFGLDGEQAMPAPAPKPSKGKRKPPAAMTWPMCSMQLNGGTATVYFPARTDGTCYAADAPAPPPEVKPAPRLKDEGAKPIIQPEPWDCGDGKPTTSPCPAAKPAPHKLECGPCWGDILVNDKENYTICVPPRYPEGYVKKLMDDEQRLFDEGWYQPTLIGAAKP